MHPGGTGAENSNSKIIKKIFKNSKLINNPGKKTSQDAETEMSSCWRNVRHWLHNLKKKTTTFGAASLEDFIRMMTFSYFSDIFVAG